MNMAYDDFPTRNSGLFVATSEVATKSYSRLYLSSKDNFTTGRLDGQGNLVVVYYTSVRKYGKLYVIKLDALLAIVPEFKSMNSSQ